MIDLEKIFREFLWNANVLAATLINWLGYARQMKRINCDGGLGLLTFFFFNPFTNN